MQVFSFNPQQIQDTESLFHWFRVPCVFLCVLCLNWAQVVVRTGAHKQIHMSTNEQWHVDPDLPILVVDSEGNCVASSFIGNVGCRGALAKAEARARLIAQAPAMAEQLKLAIKFIELGFAFHDGDVFGVWNNDAQDCVAALEEIISRLDAKP